MPNRQTDTRTEWLFELLTELKILTHHHLPFIAPIIAVFLVLAVLGWILSTLDASLAEGGAEHQNGGGGGAKNINFKISRNGLKHRKTNM